MTTGVINESPEEYEAVNFSVNKEFVFSNVSIILKTFNLSEDMDLFDKGEGCFFSSSIIDTENVFRPIEIDLGKDFLRKK